MPTFREDLHLGHKVPLTETDDICDKAITGNKIADRVIDWFHIIVKAIRNEHIDDAAVDARTIAGEAVETHHIKDSNVTHEKLADDAVGTNNLQNEAVTPEKLDSDLLNQIRSAGQHGIAVSNQFGTDPLIGVSQLALTNAFAKIWDKLEDMTGEALQGINMRVTPDFFISEDGCTVHVTATTVEANGIFEHIQFFLNGTKVAEAENTDRFEQDFEITETTVIKCVAKIMGIEYTRQHTITHYNSFWLGAGTSYTDIMDEQHVIPITNGMRGAYDVATNSGDNLFVIIGETLRPGFLRADMNGFEIPFTEQTVTIEGKNYVVLTSQNTYQAGEYNIDING